MLSEDKTSVFILALLFNFIYHVYDHSSPMEGNLDIQAGVGCHMQLRLP